MLMDLNMTITIILNLILPNLEHFVYFYKFNIFFRNLSFSESARAGSAYHTDPDCMSLLKRYSLIFQ